MRTHSRDPRPGSPRPRRRRRRRAVLLALAAAVLAAACGDVSLDTRTFELQHLEPEEAANAVEPYVYDDRPDAPGRLSVFPGGVTVRETEDNLEKIGRVLERLDRPTPGLRLHFQIIQADGAGDADPRIAGVQETLRRLFRFEGYQLLAEAQMGAMEGGSSTQVIREQGEEYGIFAAIHQVRHTGEGGRVRLEVRLMGMDAGAVINTSMTVPVGRTVVLGSAKPDPDRAALILTVRPELVPMGGPEGGEMDTEGAEAGGAGDGEG